MWMERSALGAILLSSIVASGCSGCDQAESAPIDGAGEVRVVVDVVDGVPSDLDVDGDYYRLPKDAWRNFPTDGSEAVVQVNDQGGLTLRKVGVDPVALEGPIRCE